MVTSCLQKIESRYPKFGLQDIDCDLGCLIYAYIYATAASQWRIVEIQLLASVGWKRVCESSGCRCSQHVTTCLSKESILAINSKHPLPLRATARSTNSTFLHHSQIRCSWRKPVSCREAEGLVTELWSPKSVTMYWLSSSVTTADKVFSLRGLETRLWAFQLQMFGPCVTTCLFQDPFQPFRFGIPSIHSLPEAWGSWEPQYAPPILHYACIMPIPSLQLQKKTSLMQRSKGFGHGVVVSKICYAQYSDCVQGLGYRVLIVLSVVTRDCCKPMKSNEQLSRLTGLRF